MSQIRDLLEQRFSNNTVAPNHFGELLMDYQGSGLAPPHMIQELTIGWRAGTLGAHLGSDAIPTPV